jgi:hypothetical protein
VEREGSIKSTLDCPTNNGAFPHLYDFASKCKSLIQNIDILIRNIDFIVLNIHN